MGHHTYRYVNDMKIYLILIGPQMGGGEQNRLAPPPNFFIGGLYTIGL